jgi:hypothetical protein
MMVGNSGSASTPMRTARLVARLREHDWLAAVIELAIVVVGILIALQVSNWNQDRVDRDRAQAYYRRLHADLLADRRAMDLTQAFWAKVGRYGDAAMANGETGKLADGSEWKTVLAWYQAGQIMPFELSDTTYNEMRSGGDLALIADENLRKQLADYYRLSGTGIEANLLHHDPAYRLQVRGLTPWRIQQYIWSHCFNETSEVMTQQLIDCPSPIGEQQAAAILAGYRQSPALLDNLRAWMAILQVSHYALANAREDDLRLTAEIEAARKR